MPDNYGRYTESEVTPTLVAFLYPKCDFAPAVEKTPLFCPKCGLLGAHVGEPR